MTRVELFSAAGPGGTERVAVWEDGEWVEGAAAVGGVYPSGPPETADGVRAGATGPGLFATTGPGGPPADPESGKLWVPYVGPDDGAGWQNTEDPDDIRYTDEPPGETPDPDDFSDEDLERLADESGMEVSEVRETLEDALGRGAGDDRAEVVSGVPIRDADKFSDEQMDAAVRMAEMSDELGLDITEISSTENLPEERRDAMAGYDDDNRSLHINPDVLDSETLEGWYEGFPQTVADPRVEHTVAHEVFHALDHQTGDGLTPVQYDDRETEADEIEDTLGQQAWFSPREMVAEVGAFLLLGEEPPDERSKELFEKYADTGAIDL